MSDVQKYSRLRCLLHVKGLVICFYLGWSVSIRAALTVRNRPSSWVRQRISRDKVEFNALKDLKFNTDVISFQYREKEKNATSSFCYMSLELSSFKKPKRSASDIVTSSRKHLCCQPHWYMRVQRVKINFWGKITPFEVLWKYHQVTLSRLRPSA